jgi:hypothetical protein
MQAEDGSNNLNPEQVGGRRVDIRLLVVILTVAAVGAVIGMSNYKGAERHAEDAQIKSKMHILQFALESYATDHAAYLQDSKHVESLAPYFPGGAAGLPDGFLVFTAKQLGCNTQSDVLNIDVANLPKPLKPGTVAAILFDDGDYAVVSLDQIANREKSNAGKPLVLSNF